MSFRWLDAYRWWWCALSGLLLAWGFAPFAFPVCGWIALVPAWWLVTRCEAVRLRPIRHGYLIGLVYFGIAFWWISNVTVAGALFLILYASFYPGIWLLLVARLLLTSPATGTARIILRSLAAAALWVVLEWWRSWFLTGFDWDELGASQSASVVFRQMAAYGGVSLLSFLLVLVNILWAEGLLGIVEMARRKRIVRPSGPFACALLIVAATFALGWHHLLRHRGDHLGPSVSFACIQPDVPPVLTGDDGWEGRATAREVALSRTAIKGKPDLLVWPEAITDEGIFQDRPLNDAVHSICQDFGGYFLLGSQDFDFSTRKLYNCAYMFTPYGEQYQYYQKTHLVVWGEYMPLGSDLPWLRKWIGMGLDFSPGPGPKNFELEKPAVTFAPLICFEDTLEHTTAAAARLHPDFFVTLSNDAWYTGLFAQWGVRQHLNLAVFRCVEHDRPLLRCSNNGVSCVVDQDGTVTSRLRDAAGHDVDVAGIFAGKLAFYPARSTAYEKWGDWIVLLSSVASVMLGLAFFIRRFRRLRES